MKILTLVFLTLILNTSLAARDLAQHAGQGYGFVGIDGYGSHAIGNVISVGAGGEGLVCRGMAVGADIGYVAPRGDFDNGGFGLLTLGPSYHFTNKQRTRRIVPFLAGGYGLAFRGDTLNTGYYGGGATFWFHDRFGLRLELRDYRSQYGRFLSSFRIAFSFR